MDKPHTIKRSDFAGFEAKTLMASSSTEKKRLWSIYDLDFGHYFRLEWGVDIKIEHDFDKVIKLYNNIKRPPEK